GRGRRGRADRRTGALRPGRAGPRRRPAPPRRRGGWSDAARPAGIDAVTDLLLVVPSGADTTEGRRLVALAQALADQPGVALTTLLWTAGPLVAHLAEVGRVVD